METFRITFFREDDKEVDGDGNIVSSVIEVMAVNEETVIKLFQSAEPFATIIRIDRV